MPHYLLGVFVFPAGVITREIKVGPASDLSFGTPYEIRVMISPSRSLIWNASPVIASMKTFAAHAGENRLIPLPVTDQQGYTTSSGHPVDLSPGEHAFYYKIDVFYLNSGSVVSRFPTIRALIPEGTEPVDIDTMVHFSSKAGIISVPDSWSASLAAAQAAAQAAADSAADVADSLENLDEFVGTSVDEWFSENPDSVVSPENLAAAIQAHEEDPEPHKAYDLDIPSLSVLFENGLV